MKYLKNVSSLKFFAEKCTTCFVCIDVCPHGVFRLKNKKIGVADKDLCMECGACALNCKYELAMGKKRIAELKIKIFFSSGELNRKITNTVNNIPLIQPFKANERKGIKGRAAGVINEPAIILASPSNRKGSP